MQELVFSVTLPQQGKQVTSVLDVPDGFEAGRTPVVILGHGAGADLRSEFMEYYATELSMRGLCVVRFNFPYKEEGGRRPPNPMKTLVATYHRVILASAERTGSPPGPLFIGGKSMGGRVSTVLASMGHVKPSGFVLLGYPLHPPGRKDKMRTENLQGLKAPVLFVQGDRDTLCDLELLRPVRKQLKLSGSLHVIEGGDHSFKMLAANRHKQVDELERVADIVLAFVNRVLKR